MRLTSCSLFQLHQNPKWSSPFVARPDDDDDDDDDVNVFLRWLDTVFFLDHGNNTQKN